MKKSSCLLLLILLVIGGYFGWTYYQTGNFRPEFFSSEARTINQMARSFMEDIQFKDFKKAASYHSPEDQKDVNIPQLIERLFQIKPEFLDIMEYNILDTQIDSSGTRCRVKLQAKVHLLNTEETRNPEIILYFHKKDGNWYMELESSIR